jgi:mono/diheme cytochrome c family protein
MVMWLSYITATCAKSCGQAQSKHAIKGSNMRISIAYPILALLICSNESTLAQDADKKKIGPDANQGSSLAQRWCASCHIVSSSQSKGIDGTLSFASIAQKADFTAEKLAHFLLEPHPKMPNMSLSRDAANDIAAYIAEQRR